MVLEVVHYGHPALRQKGAPIETIDPQVQQLIADMLDTMYAARGVGLAAQQVARPLQLTVIDVREVTDRPSTLHLHGQPANVDAFMPLVLINPQVTPTGTPETGPEGCLSFPEIYADITRPGAVDVTALDRHGQPVAFHCGGLLARVVQHEVDHLRGILFIDRMDRAQKAPLQEELAALQAATKAALQKKSEPPR